MKTNKVISNIILAGGIFILGFVCGQNTNAPKIQSFNNPNAIIELANRMSTVTRGNLLAVAGTKELGEQAELELYYYLLPFVKMKLEEIEKVRNKGK